MEFGESEPISGDGFWFVKDVGLKGYKGFLVFLRELIQNGYDAYLSRSEEYRAKNPLKYMIFHDKVKKLIIFRNNGAPLNELDIQRLKKPGKYALEGNNNRIGEHNSGILTGFRLTNEILFRSGSRILSLALDWDKKIYFAQLSEKTTYFLDGTEVWISYKDKIDPQHKWYLNYPIEQQDLEQLNAISDYLSDEYTPIFLFLDGFKECIIIEREETSTKYISITRNHSAMIEPPFDSSKDIKVSIVEISKCVDFNLNMQSKIAKIIEDFAQKQTLHEKKEDSISIFQNQEIIDILSEFLVDRKKISDSQDRKKISDSQDRKKISDSQDRKKISDSQDRKKISDSQNLALESVKYLVFSRPLDGNLTARWPYFVQLKKKGVDLQKLFLENRFSSNPEIDIAFSLSNDSFLRPIQGKIFVFLPSTLDIGLHFHINGRFKSSTSRESLVFEGLDGIYNKYMIEEASQLTEKCFELLRIAIIQSMVLKKNQDVSKKSIFSDIDLLNQDYLDRWYEIIISDIQKNDIKFASIYEICDKEVSNYFFTNTREVKPISTILLQPTFVQKEMAEIFNLLLNVVQIAYKDKKFISYPIKSQKIHNKLTRPLSRAGFGVAYLSFSAIFQVMNSDEISLKMSLQWWNDALTVALRFFSFENQSLSNKLLLFPNNLGTVIPIGKLMLIDCEFSHLEALLSWIPEDLKPNLFLIRSQQRYWSFLFQILKNSGISILDMNRLLKLMETRLQPFFSAESQEKQLILKDYISTFTYFTSINVELKDRQEQIIITKNRMLSPLQLNQYLVIADTKEFDALKEIYPDIFLELRSELAEIPVLKPIFIKLGIYYSISNEFVVSYYKHLMNSIAKVSEVQFTNIFLKSSQYFSKYTFNGTILKAIGLNMVLPHNDNLVPIQRFTIFNPDSFQFGPSIVQTFFQDLKEPVLFVNEMEVYQFLVNLGAKKIPDPLVYVDIIEKAWLANHIEVRLALYSNAAVQATEWKAEFVRLLKSRALLPINEPKRYNYVLDFNDANTRLFGESFGAFPILDHKVIEKLQIEIRKFAPIKDILEKWCDIKTKSNLNSEILEENLSIIKKIDLFLEYVDKGYQSKEYKKEDLNLNILRNEDLILILSQESNDKTAIAQWIGLSGLIYDDFLGIHQLIFGKNEKFFGKSTGYSQEWYGFFEALDGIKTLSVESILQLFDQMEKIYDSEKKIDPDKFHGLYIYLSQIFGQLPDFFKINLKKKKCVVAFEFNSNSESYKIQNKSDQIPDIKTIVLKKPSEVYFIDEPLIASKFSEKGKKIYVPVKFDFKSDSFLERLGIRKFSEVVHKSLLKTEIQGNQRFFSEDKMKKIFLSIQPIILSLIQHKLGSKIADQVFEDFKTIKIIPCQSLAINYSFDGTVIHINKQLILNLPNLYFTQTLISNFEQGIINDLVDEFALLIANNQQNDAPFIRDMLHNVLSDKNPQKYLKERGIQSIDSWALISNQKEYEKFWDFRTIVNNNPTKNVDLKQALKQRRSIEMEYHHYPVNVDDRDLRDFLKRQEILLGGRQSQIEIDDSVPELNLIQITMGECPVFIPKGLTSSEIQSIKHEFSDLKELTQFIDALQKAVRYMGFKNVLVNPIITFEPIAAFYSEGVLSINLFYAGKGSLYQRLKIEKKFLISWLILLCHELAHFFEQNHTLIWQKRFETLISFVIEKIDEIYRMI